MATKVTSLVTELTVAGFIPKYLQCDNVGEMSRVSLLSVENVISRSK